MIKCEACNSKLIIQKTGAHIRCESNKNKNNIITMLLDFLENCVNIMTTVCLAELIRRIFKFFIENCIYGKRYLPDQRVLHIFKRVFSISKLTQVFIVTLLMLMLLETGLNRRWPLPPAKLLLYMPLYWIYHGVQLSHSSLDFANFIRERHGLDYGEGMASSYFHGYINLTMPSYTGELGIRERIELFEAQENVKFAVNRLVILIPNTMYTAPMIESPILKKVTGLQTVIKNRAGVNRPYQSDVYRFTKEINGKFYYIAMEGATPLLTFFEATRSEVTATWQMKEFQREILLKFFQSLKRIINESPETQNEVELIFYDVKKPDGTPQDIGQYLKNHFENQMSSKNHDKTD